ncbi:MAG TPA: PLP-dependent aspartate aminotransferase family protein [Ktedonobacterales bacterium]|nr:PLP-dependent aspartate aminotransferase family protein [Ktedonobacterales bacterium]
MSEEDETTPPRKAARAEVRLGDTIGFATRAVHAGLNPSLQGTRPTTVPIYTATTFLSHDAQALDGVLAGAQPGYVYGRYANPTLTSLESAMSALLGVDDANTVAFSSGMAALHAALFLCELEPGDTVLAGSELYGASHTMLATLFGQFGVRVRFANMADLASVRAALGEEPTPRAVLFETISNPLIRVADVAGISSAARAVGALTIADTTFTPPPILQPLPLGVDIVVQSATKYIGGHGDVMGGLLTVADPDRVVALRQISKLGGAILGPFEAFLIARGLRTLAIRLERQCENAATLARRLTEHPRIAAVHYPGLVSHPQHTLAETLLTRPYWGAMLALDIKDAAYDDVLRFFDALKLVLPATTLGDIFTEVSYPLMSSHREWSPAQLRRVGITPGIVRVSVGIENIEDIVADFEQALAAIEKPTVTTSQPLAAEAE